MSYIKTDHKKSNDSLRVSFFSHSSLRGGAELSLLELISGLSNRHIQCHVVLPSEGYLFEELSKLPVFIDIIPIRWWTYRHEEDNKLIWDEIIDSSARIVEIVSKLSPDLIYTNTSVIPHGALVADFLKIPHIWHITEYGEKDHNLTFLLDIENRAKFINDYSDKIIFNSRALKIYFDQFINSNKSIVSYTHIELHGNEEKYPKIFKKTESLKLLLIGQIQPGKGQLEALKALKYCIEIFRNNVTLAIVGRITGSHYYHEIQSFINNHDLHDYVTVRDFLHNPMCAYQESDVVLMCSRSEAFGRVTAEAMRLGKTVIGANAGGTPELIKHQKTGLLYEAGNYKDLAKKIDYLYKHRGKISELGNNAMNFVGNKLTEEKNCGKIYHIILNMGKKVSKVNSPVIFHKELIIKYNNLSDKYNNLLENNNNLSDKYNNLSDKYNNLLENNNNLSDKYNNLLENNNNLSDKYSGFLINYNKLSENYNCLLGKHNNLSEKLNNLNKEIQRKNHEIATIENQLEETKQLITNLYASRSWRVTRPLRQIDAVIRKLRYLVVASAQRIYDATPLPAPIRTQVTNFVFTYFGTFFKGTDPYKHWLDTINTGVVTDQSNLVPIETYYEKVPDSIDKVTRLTFINPEAPIVSIVIPVFNNWRYTYACINAIRGRSGDDIPYEVIIADDGSTDDTNMMFERIHGIHVLKNTNNLGFLRNCNNAVRHARGKYVVFLNNDTEVQSDWLNPLVNLFERFSNVGMVGGRLLYADGGVQEAGGIILQNGWGHPYGRGANPAYYEFNYVREVDCLIGACLMVEKDVFLSLGGFDEAFAPAFYEEFDFAFTLRKHGYKIMYQPASSILHFDSSSYGTELRDKQSTINHQKFCSKWQDVLTQQALSKDDLFLARDRSRGKKIILVIDDKVPEYDKHAGGLTIYQYVRLFRDMGFKVIFLPDNLYPSAPYTAELQQLGVEVIYGDIDIKEWLARCGKYLHFAWLARPDIASKYIDFLIKSTSSKILYFTHDLHYLRERRRYELDYNPLHLDESQRLKKLEFDLFSRVDVILTPSNYEERVIKENFPHKNVFTIPLHFYEFPPENDKPGVDFSQREGMLFLGGFLHQPNVDAVLWFFKEILPRVRERLPDVTFTVAGSNPSQEILALQNESLRVTGYVPDLRPLFEKTRVFVAPLRYGAGVKGKIVTSMMYGVPVVTTSIGNEGLNLTDGQEALIADEPEAFAARTAEIYTNQALWERLAHEAQTYVRHHFGTEKARQLMQTVMGRGLCGSRNG